MPKRIKPQCTPRAYERRHYRDKLKKLQGLGEQCNFPGCTGEKILEDVCYDHALEGLSRTEEFVPNDGIIDWQAIDLAVSGARPVRLSWIENEIAGAMILNEGETFEEMGRRLGITPPKSGTPKRAAYLKVANALRAA